MINVYQIIHISVVVQLWQGRRGCPNRIVDDNREWALEEATYDLIYPQPLKKHK